MNVKQHRRLASSGARTLKGRTNVLVLLGSPWLQMLEDARTLTNAQKIFTVARTLASIHKARTGVLAHQGFLKQETTNVKVPYTDSLLRCSSHKIRNKI